MLRFFRKIRQRLLSDNKFTKYLLYAAGEIVLVTAGILIALQINTWNENRKKEIQANIYLNDLKMDIQFDIQTLDSLIVKNQERIDNLSTIVFTLATKSELQGQEMIDFVNLHEVLLFESYFIPEKSTIRQIEASSHGNLIRNKDIKDRLFRYYSTNDRNEKNQEVSTQLYQHNYLSKDIVQAVMIGGNNIEALYGTDLDRPHTNFKTLSQNSTYIGAMGMKNSNTETQNKQYKKIREMAVEILQLIKDELEDKAD